MNVHWPQNHRKARHGNTSAAASEAQATQQQLVALSFIGSLMHRLMRMQSVRCKRAALVGGSLLAQWLEQALRERWQIMANLTRKSAFVAIVSLLDEGHSAWACELRRDLQDKHIQGHERSDVACCVLVDNCIESA